MSTLLKELEVKKEFIGFYVLKNYSESTKKTGEPYFRIDVSDVSGTVNGVCWENPENYNVDANCVGCIVKLKGLYDIYNGTPQIKVHNIRKITDEEFNEIDKSSLLPHAPIDIETEFKKVYEYLNSIKDEDYKKIAFHILAETKDKFISIPAGKSVHHAFIGGLLMHTCNMMKIANFYSAMYQDIVDRDLLMTATFLHDNAKIDEFELTNLNLVQAYSLLGQLMGHLVMGAEKIERAANELNIDSNQLKIQMLKHLILSHHGSGEMGSPVTPKTAEAELLHLIDLTDSRLEMYAEEYKNLEVGEVTKKDNWALGHRIYRYK